MKRLSSEEFWEVRHQAQEMESAAVRTAPRRGLRRFLDRARTRIGGQPHQSYGNYLFELCLKRHLPVRRDWSALEVGCAPGGNMLQFNRLFGYIPFGVEYSHVGAETSRTVLSQNGFDGRNVMESDFFASSFQNEYRGRFDVVFSCGFIEHFDDPRKAVEAHVNLLKTDGYLICTIPNLRSFGYPLLRLIARDVLDAHNLPLMRPSPFRALFDDLGLVTTFCGCLGVFQIFGLILRNERSLRGHFMRIVSRSTDIIDHLMFLTLRGRSVETRWSPHLVYIGRKRSQSPGIEPALRRDASADD